MNRFILECGTKLESESRISNGWSKHWRAFWEQAFFNSTFHRYTPFCLKFPIAILFPRYKIIRFAWLFQSRACYFGHLSTHSHVTFYVEPPRYFCCIVIHSSEDIQSNAFLFAQIHLLYCKFQLSHGDVMALLSIPIIDGGAGLIAVLIACELGHRMADAFDEVYFAIKQFDWYLFPIEGKRMLPMAIVIAEQPISLECFGSITCTRDVFKNVGNRKWIK